MSKQTKTSHSAPSEVSRLTHQATGRAPGYRTKYTYDNIGQLQTALGKEPGGTTNRLNEQLGYGYDAAGNLNFRTNNALVQTFQVNTLNELTNALRSGTLTVGGCNHLPGNERHRLGNGALLYSLRLCMETIPGHERCCSGQRQQHL